MQYPVVTNYRFPHNRVIVNRRNVSLLKRNPELYYRYSPELMSRLPGQLVDCWIAESSNLDPVKLIPALVQLSSVRTCDGITQSDVGSDGDNLNTADTFEPRAPYILQSIR